MKPFTIAQISDLHFTRLTYNPLLLCSKRVLGLLNWFFCRKKHFSQENINSLPPLLKTLNVDHILLGGDFTSTALASEFEDAKKWIASLPAPWIAIPGNHDYYTYGASWTNRYFRTIHNPIPAHLGNLEKDRVEAKNIHEGWWVVSLHTARAANLYSSRGLFSALQEAKLLALLERIPKEDSILLFNHYPFFQNDAHRRRLARGEALQKIIERDARIKLYLHGHTHRHIIADLQPSKLPVILDSGSAADAKRGTWNLLTISNEHLLVEVYRWHGSWLVERKETIAWIR